MAIMTRDFNSVDLSDPRQAALEVKRRALEMGADVIVAVDVLGDARVQTKKYNIFTLMFRAFEVVDAELTRHKMEIQKPDLYIRPELGDMDQYKFKNLDFAYQAGYEVGKANVKAIKKLIK